LHEAAQKGRTQLCALLLAHGADPTLKNQEGQTPLDLVSVSDGLFEKSSCSPDLLKFTWYI
jgi:tankyrase